jgi:hypothetical protein
VWRICGKAVSDVVVSLRGGLCVEACVELASSTRCLCHIPKRKGLDITCRRAVLSVLQEPACQTALTAPPAC